LYAGKNPRESAWSASSAFQLTLQRAIMLRRYNLYPHFDIIPKTIFMVQEFSFFAVKRGLEMRNQQKIFAKAICCTTKRKAV
ncbi:MAG: hypothetical protein LH618_18530, partial [Saprospiraceae bacterium]|nr:hypothetical protein [Saprospiraceae bacterium]